MRHIVLGCLIAALIAVVGMSIAEAQDPPRIDCTWRAPDTGSPVQQYQLRILDVDGGLDTLVTVPARPGVTQAYQFEGQFLRRYISQVRGFDALGRPGTWSAFSDTTVFEEVEPEP